MRRFTSLKQVPAETRRILRDRLARYLPSPAAMSPRAGGGGVTLSDESLLDLLLGLTIDFVSDLKNARAAYDAARPPGSSEPTFDDVIQSAWFRIVWGRLSMPSMVTKRGRALSPESAGALLSLMQERFKQTFHFAEAARNRTDLAEIVAAIGRGDYEPRNLACQSPEWVAARLWDRPLKDAVDRDAALRTWVDRWDLLGAPTLVPARAWEQDAADAFRETALKAVESESGLPGWAEFRALIIKEVALSRDQPASDFEQYVPQIPATLVDRALWLMDPQTERAARDTFDACDDIFGLVRLLLDDIQAEPHAPAPHKLAARLFALTLDRPELLLNLVWSVRWKPVLLADLLLYPATSALACLLIAQWRSQPSGWDRELTLRDDGAAKSVAFADAVSVMGHFLEQGSLQPAEAAALLNWMHAAGPGSADDPATKSSLLSTLRGELAGQSQEILRALVGALTAPMPAEGLGTSTFAAALDIVDAGGLAGEIEPKPLIEAYVNSLSTGDYTLSAHRVSLSGAATLVELATRAPANLRRKFLSPLDIQRRIAAANAANDNIYTVMDGLARAIRAHIRILSRAAAGTTGTLPDDVATALIAMVRAGALEHPEKGRVAAFSPRFEAANPFGGLPDRPIAADLGAALTKLGPDPRKRLLAAILETDEPTMLAQLLAFAPPNTREEIKRRIAELTPSDAGDVRSLPEAQARIEALLTAGLADAAAAFIEAERDLQTLGKVAGRDTVRLRYALRLKLVQGDWTGIENTQLPPDFPKGEQPAALETIEFYKALAALTSPGGNREAAEHRFARLQHRRPDVAAYANNLFAARISILLGSNGFAQLDGAELVRGRQVLAEADQMMLRLRSVSDSDAEIFKANKAILLLALGQPAAASELVAPLRATRDNAAAYAAIALARMGHHAEAKAVLDQAEQTLGDTDILRAARNHIQSGDTFAAVATVSAEDNPTQRIKAALSDLRQLSPTLQAAILHPETESLVDFMTDQVRLAAASFLGLASSADEEQTAAEDDITASLQALLIPRFHMLGWSVLDQPRGGVTAKGNPGRRDLVLKKDSAELAVIEAVVCDRPVSQEWARQELTSHFQKLLAYSTCTSFFHLTYSYVDDPASVLAYLKHTAEHDVTADFSYRQCRDILHADSGPAGFIARYFRQSGDLNVVFLLLDMNQKPQRNAAKAADASNPRNKKKSGTARTNKKRSATSC